MKSKVQEQVSREFTKYRKHRMLHLVIEVIYIFMIICIIYDWGMFNCITHIVP